MKEGALRSRLPIEGILPAMITPFTASADAVDEDALVRAVERLIRSGVSGLVTCGTTGEFASLSKPERKRVTQVVIEAARNRVPVLAQTGALSTADAVELSVHAEGAGAAGVVVVPPFYDLKDWRELVAYYRAIASTVEIPITLYNIPSTTGVNLSPHQIGELAAIDGVAFIKDSSGDIGALTQLIYHYSDRITVLLGWDSLTFYGFLAGAKGAIWGAANLIPELCVGLFQAFRTDDLRTARELWARIWPVCDFLENHGYVASIKAGCELIGKAAGPPRPPMLPLEEEAVGLLRRVLEQVGIIAGNTHQVSEMGSG